MKKQLRKKWENWKHSSQWVAAMRTVAVLAAVCFLIVLYLKYRDVLTIDNIVNLTPSNSYMAMGFMLILFALKSLTVFMYAGILYAACGILFPLPTAILINILGTVVMTSIPYCIGKRAGSKVFDRLLNRYSKLEPLRNLTNKNECFIAMIVRLIRTPSDLAGMCLGASGIGYKSYLLGSTLGMAPTVLCYSVMGMSIHDASSPAFVISVICEISLMLASMLLFQKWKKRR